MTARAPDLCDVVLDGRYELRELIGEGAFGRVYRGFDRRLARAVAVKVIKPWWAQDSTWVERFQREAQLLARVSDPGIVQIFDIGHSERDGPYYVAELIEGESLAERLRRGPLPPREACGVAEELCLALAGAHARGIVHCDVKPANVLIAADGRKVKVGDFGVARLAEGTSQQPSATVAGTPRYMSPEQARGRPTGPPTDVYSAGVVLYEMLAGEPPFAHGSAVELGLHHLQDEPPPLPASVPAPLRTVVCRALAKDPAERYRDGAAMALALRRASPPAEPAQTDLVATEHAAANPTRTLDANSKRDMDASSTTVMGESPTRVVGGHRTRVLSGRRRRGASVEAPPRRLRSRPARKGIRGRWPIVLPVTLLLLALGALAFALRGGPAPVKVPRVVGRPSASAESVLARAGLRYATYTVPAPGSEPGVVTRQSPASSARAARGATVALSVAEAPRWRTLASFSGVDGGGSVPLRILGSRWRIDYHMTYEGTCTLLVICLGPSAEVENLNTGSTFGQFELGEGEAETHTFESGPGLYRVRVSGGHDSAKWSMTVADYY
ncbi:MAG TPA: serine/threonine-protein kinase [Solirubrobacteraceae bacterium]|jgi:hypothetical protein